MNDYRDQIIHEQNVKLGVAMQRIKQLETAIRYASDAARDGYGHEVCPWCSLHADLHLDDCIVSSLPPEEE